MKSSYWIASITTALMLAALPAQAQLPKDPEERAKVIAQIMQANARQITLFDREGKEAERVGSRDLYNQVILSPDRKRVAVIKADLEKEANDLWLLDTATGKGPQITFSKSREQATTPVWSPDGSQIAYVALRDGSFGIFRRPSTAEGTEELLHKASAPISLTDWSMDGRFLSFFSSDLGGGALYALPLEGAGERKPIEMLRIQNQLQSARFSPDSRFISYISNQSGKNEIFVRPFNPAAAPGPAPASGPWQISDGATGMASWRRDGKELFYLAADRSIMSVSVTISPDFEFGKPKALFRVPDAIGLAPGSAMMSRDGERLLVAVPPTQLRQLTMFDRTGKVVSAFGPPGIYAQPNISPDGKHVVVMRNDPQTSNQDIWTYDLASGKGIAVTNDTPPDQAPIWSPDGSKVAYVSTRQSYAGIYRKAWDGTGEEELLFRYTPGAGMVLTDWSPDGKFVTFFTGVLLLVPVANNQPGLERKAIDWLREDYDVIQGRFSPDGKYIAYLTDEKNAERLEVYVRPFDGSKPEAPPPGTPVQVSKNGAVGMVNWRQDGKEMYFMTRDWEVMAVDVTTAPTI